VTLAPIRGAPPDAPNPDFPVDEPMARPAQPTAAPADCDQHQISPSRQRQTPIEIRSNDIALTFKVIPELPAIARASMTVHVVVDPRRSASSHALGFLRMSAANARAFLTGLRDGRSPIVAMGDEDGTLEIEYKIKKPGSVFLVRKPGEQHALHCCIIDRGYDLQTAANELLADLGA
jgi:hypothetical protein